MTETENIEYDSIIVMLSNGATIEFNTVSNLVVKQGIYDEIEFDTDLTVQKHVEITGHVVSKTRLVNV